MTCGASSSRRARAASSSPRRSSSRRRTRLSRPLLWGAFAREHARRRTSPQPPPRQRRRTTTRPWGCSAPLAPPLPQSEREEGARAAVHRTAASPALQQQLLAASWFPAHRRRLSCAAQGQARGAQALTRSGARTGRAAGLWLSGAREACGWAHLSSTSSLRRRDVIVLRMIASRPQFENNLNGAVFCAWSWAYPVPVWAHPVLGGPGVLLRVPYLDPPRGVFRV